MNVQEFHGYLKLTHTFACGITQCGKSTIVSNILSKFIEQNKDCKILIFNTQQLPEFQRLGVNTNCYESTIGSFTQNQTTIYNPQLRFSSEQEYFEISSILQQVFNIQDYYKRTEKQKRVLIVVDEISQYCHKLYGINVNEFPLITSRGLKPYKINLLSISQRIQQVHNSIVSQSPNLIIGYLGDEDYKLAKSYYAKLPYEQKINDYYEFYFCNWKVLERIQ